VFSCGDPAPEKSACQRSGKNKGNSSRDAENEESEKRSASPRGIALHRRWPVATALYMGAGFKA
jgi:hypothetical protein